MAKAKISSSVKLGSLGAWQQPILDAVEAKLSNAKVSFSPLPMGRAALVVTWAGFKGHDVVERQGMVRNAMKRLGAEAERRVSVILTFTPGEARGLGDS